MYNHIVTAYRVKIMSLLLFFATCGSALFYLLRRFSLRGLCRVKYATHSGTNKKGRKSYPHGPLFEIIVVIDSLIITYKVLGP